MTPDEPTRVVQIALGRFHHFNLARQLEKRGMLEEIWTGYPRFKLADEQGIPTSRIKTFPWFFVPRFVLPRVPVVGRSQRIARELHWRAIEAIDRHVARRIGEGRLLVGLSSGGLHSGRRAQALGGRYVCDRGSTHIRFQDEILRQEYRRWGLDFEGVDPRVVEKEEREYEAADLITIPSQFCRDSFVAHGVKPEKLRVLPYGARTDRFSPQGAPDPDRFTIVFVGGVSVRKGVPYLLQAFARLACPGKRLKIIGTVQDDIRPLLATLPLEGVEFVDAVPNRELATHYSTADVMVLPSIEEGLALVMTEAMACGCPVIATENSGARNLFDDGGEGYIIPVQSVDAIVEALDRLAQDRALATRMRGSAVERTRSLGGYDHYGALWADVIGELTGRTSMPEGIAATLSAAS